MPRPSPLTPGLALTTVYSWDNEDASLYNVLGVFTAYYNWSVDFGDVDISQMQVGDTDFYGVSANSLLSSMSATFGICYDVDSTNYKITLRDTNCN